MMVVSASSMFRRVRRLVAAACIAAALACAAPAARAQFGMGMDASMRQDMITRRGLDAYAKLLGLDKDQKETAATLLEGNQTATRNAMKEFQAKMEALGEKARDSGDFSVYQKEMPAISKEVGARVEELEKGFFGDLKALLNDEQLKRWDKVERYRRREQAMRFGFVSGSAVDLIAVVDKTKSAPEGNAEFADTLNQYELEVDRMLQAFEKMGKDAQKDFLEGEGAMFDMQKIEKMMKKFYESAKDVRDTNRSYARKLSPMMTEENRARFEAEVKRRSFPRVYKPGHVTKLFDASLGFGDLTAEQRESLKSLRESYERDVASVNDRWAKATEEKEDKAGGTMMVMMQGYMGQGDPNDPVKKIKDERKELDTKTQDKLEGILTAAQKGKLPQKVTEPVNPMADFMPEGEPEEQESK